MEIWTGTRLHCPIELVHCSSLERQKNESGYPHNRRQSNIKSIFSNILLTPAQHSVPWYHIQLWLRLAARYNHGCAKGHFDDISTRIQPWCHTNADHVCNAIFETYPSMLVPHMLLKLITVFKPTVGQEQEIKTQASRALAFWFQLTSAECRWAT